MALQRGCAEQYHQDYMNIIKNIENEQLLVIFSLHTEVVPSNRRQAINPYKSRHIIPQSLKINSYNIEGFAKFLFFTDKATLT